MRPARAAALASAFFLAAAAPVLIVESLARFFPRLLPFNGRILAAVRLLDREVYRRDPDLGHCLRTPFEKRLRWGEFDLRVRHEPLPGTACGYRADPGGGAASSPEGGRPAPDGEMRSGGGADIVALGDSHVYGMEVDSGSTWASLLGRLSGRSVANLGVRMYGSTQAVELYRRYGKALRPRLVLLMLCPTDPFDDAVFDGWLAGEGVAPGLAADEMLYRVCRTLSLESSPAACRAAAGFGKLGFLPHMMLGRTVAFLYGGFPAGSRLEERGHALLRRDVLSLRGERLAVILNEDWPERRRVELAGFLEANRVPFLDLARSRPGGEGGRVALDGHWNALGHRRVAERVFEFLEKEKLLP